WPAGLHRDVKEDRRVLPPREEQGGPLELGNDLTDDVDRLGLERVEVREEVGHETLTRLLNFLIRGPQSPAAGPTWVRAQSVARASTSSFTGSPAWPFTQRNRTVGPRRSTTSSMSGSQRSRFATGSFFAFRQPRARQPAHQRSRKQFTT